MNQIAMPLPSNGKSDEFYTPARIFDPLHAEFRFTVDACATSESAKVSRFWSKAQDGLAQPWGGERLWVNPPYSHIEPWAAKAAREFNAPNYRTRPKAIVMLLPCWTDRAWWHDHVEPARREGIVSLRFVRGRIRFGMPGDPEGKTGTTGTFPSVIVVWR